MMKWKMATMLEGDFMVMIDGSDYYKSGDVVAVKMKLMSKKLELFDYDTGNRIIALRQYDGKEYCDMDVDSFHTDRHEIVGMKVGWKDAVSD